MLTILAASTASAQTPITTWHYNNSRLGANTAEVLLTPGNVNTSSFGKLLTQPVDGQIVGHPLYLPGITIPGVAGVHNVVYVATMNDTVYAFDADSATSSALWTTSLLDYSPAGAAPVPIAVKGCGHTTGWTTTGVISTPAIDTTTNTIYLVAETYESSKVVHRIHALNVTTGLEESGWPVTIAATYTYNGVSYPFVDTHQMNRPGLLLINGFLYIGFGSDSCNGGDQGWVMSYSASTGAPMGAFDVEAANSFGSVWQRGGGLSADSDGNVYADTGEGGTVQGVDFASSVFKLSQIGDSLMVTDWFTPWNFQYLSNNDLDIDNSVVILPNPPGTVPEAITLGKEGTIYVLNRDSMGRLCSTCNGMDTQILQELPTVATMGNTPAVWNNSVYLTGSSKIQIYSLSNGLLTAGKSVIVGATTHPWVTANGTVDGILWVINGPRLMALDAISLAKLYTSDQAANGRDKLPVMPHFGSAIGADGKVFVGTQNSLVVYGLFPAINAIKGSQQSAAVATQLPVALEVQAINPGTGKGASGLTVTWSDGGKGGTFGSGTGVTNASGEVSTTYTLPKKIGSYTITATAVGYVPAAFTETAVVGSATALSLLSGNKQTATVGSPLPNPIVFKARDAYGNGVPRISMSFSDGGADGSFNRNPIVTDSNGEATLTYTTGQDAGTVRIVASVTGVHNISALETVTAGPASLIDDMSGSGQTASTSTVLPKPLVALVTDKYGNPVSGITVQFSDGGAGGSLSQSSVVTGTNGQALTSYTTPKVEGNVTIKGTASGLSGVAAFTVGVN